MRSAAGGGAPPRTGAGRGVPGRERGSATAELAVVLPAVLVVLVGLVLAAVAGAASLSCADAARVGARSAALGLGLDEVRADAQAAAGSEARVEVVQDGEWVRVRVVSDLRLGGDLLGGTITVSGEASARREPGT